MPIENTTANRGYQLPDGSNLTRDDVERLKAAFNKVDVDMATMLSAIAGYVTADSPVFTGTPTAPTAAPGTNNQQLATTAFVNAAAPAGSMVYKGAWDASAGTFPGDGNAKAGWQYEVSVAGTVDGVEFDVTDVLTAQIDDAATDTFAANWSKRDSTDQVTSVNSKVGAVVVDKDDVGLSEVDNTSDADKPVSTAQQAAIDAGGGGRYKGERGPIGASAGDIFRINANTLTTDVTIADGENASCTGPLAVAAGKAITVEDGGVLVIQ